MSALPPPCPARNDCPCGECRGTPGGCHRDTALQRLAALGRLATGGHPPNISSPYPSSDHDAYPAFPDLPHSKTLPSQPRTAGSEPQSRHASHPRSAPALCADSRPAGTESRRRRGPPPRSRHSCGPVPGARRDGPESIYGTGRLAEAVRAECRGWPRCCAWAEEWTEPE